MELGKSFNKAENLRLIADYKGDSLNVDDARWVVEQASDFVGAMQDQFFSRGSFDRAIQPTDILYVVRWAAGLRKLISRAAWGPRCLPSQA